ncbi:uncharacterized protein LAESUDRAFT_810872 [Laetiporus sulphureus 93-53]|uniref:DUF6533 domain-containing protein n=2 Tax=Laetiporus sulphureus 93-53 TaxID=1314785 RepID=A0A165FNX5_9APHY|nr:uncharacterized protein LAESUDRAFT_810872 [Laetiporus sulphureus 93-53]KZT09253.1 hypothetical protein LAESUDRAFT_810872 [Laetiporus sulphureus 93-53]
MQAMSSSAGENRMSPQIEAEAGDAYVANYTYFASIALMLYEHAFTIPAEISYVWSRVTLITVLLLSNRYLLLALGLIYMLNLIQWDTSWRCEFLIVTRTVIIMALQAVTAALSSLRTYAISGHKWIPALLALFLGLTPLITLLIAGLIEVTAWGKYLGSQGSNVTVAVPATFFAPIASMLGSRFILNLRRVNDRTLVTSSNPYNGTIDSRSMQFATRILGISALSSRTD